MTKASRIDSRSEGNPRADGLATAYDETLAPGDARFEAVLDERARALATPGKSAESTITNATHVKFAAEGIAFAVESDAVLRILHEPKVSRIPGAPRHLDRVLHVDGRITSTIDPVAFVDASAAQVVRRTALLVEHGSKRIAVFADSVSGLLRVEDAELEALHAAARRDDAIVVGTTASMIVLLDSRSLVLHAARAFGVTRANDS